MDTAGIRDTEDVVEKIGVDRAKENARRQTLSCMSLMLPDHWMRMTMYSAYDLKANKLIILLNKSDLDMQVTKNRKNCWKKVGFFCS